ncbi:MAG: hypothetical protein L6R36_006060 [Xanthoria steineri]|nr:MAG: hypothetical protein L6R36_006060 [Xanthoria steineri]
MSRRGYASSELYEQRERDRDYYPPRDRGGRTAEYDEVDIRERRRTSAREPDFLREDYGRSSNAGPLVLRDDKRERDSEFRPRPRDRPREVEEREVIVARGSRSERPTVSDRDLNVDREELVYRTREPERPRTREINIERDDIVYQPRPREPEPQQVRRVREDWEYRRPREPEIERETIDIRERERERPRERDFEKEEIIIRRGSGSRERERPRKVESKDQEIVIRRSSRSRERERPRQRDYREEDLDIRIRRDERERDRPRARESDRGYDKEEIIIRRDEGERERPRVREPDRGYDRDEIIIRRDEGGRDRPRTRASSYDRETIRLSTSEREPRRARSRADFQEEDITIRREERDRPSARSRDFREEDLIIRRRDASRETRRTGRSRSRSRDREDITIRHDERGGRHRDEIIIRRDEKSPSPEPVYAPPAPIEPEPIRAPPIHQEIITHHRHIDHGFETRVPAPAPAPAPVPAPAPPRPRSPSPVKSTYDEIEIRRHGSRNGRHYDEDLIITERERDRDGGQRRRDEDQMPRRRRSPSFDARSRAPYSSRDELDISEEADYYNSRAVERSYLGEGYHGANRDWAIVDVPPGTKRVQMEGIGGAKEEITWQRYNGVRRSKFVAEEDEYRGGGELMAPREVERMEPGRRYVGEKDKKDKMWTEITKDLVTEDAIKHMGYDFEETEFFYYIMSYLKYEDVLRLVEVSEDLKRDRRERIREIEWEQRHAPPPPKPRLALESGRPGGWDEERIIEREIIYEGTPPPGSRRYR